jgi:hypothetical protein
VRQRSLIAVFAGFLVLSLFSTWPLVRHLGSALPGNLGDPLLNAWILGWDADRLWHGLRGVWDAPILFPNLRTLAFSEHLFGIAIPLAPLVWLTGNPLVAYNAAFILSYVLAAVGMFLLARLITESTEAAVIAALAFAFGPVRADQASHLQVLVSGWMPICLWALHRYFSTGSRTWLAMFVAAFVWQALSNLYFFYFLALPVAVVLVFECIARRGTLLLARTFAELACAGGAILLALAPVLKVYVDVRREYGFRRSYGDLVNFSADVSSYFHVAEAVRLWSRWLAISPSAERQLFPGLIVLVLAALAFWSLRPPIPNPQSPIPNPQSQERVWCYATIALLAFLLSLGAEPSAWGRRILPFSPYLMLAKIVPGLDGLRAPARFSVIVQLGLSVLAAIGYEKWVGRLFRKASSRKRHPIPFFLLSFLIIAEGWSAPIPLAAFDAQGRKAERPLYVWLASRPQGGVLELPIKSWDVAPTLTYQYATLFHHHQIVNGYSGYGSTLQAWLGGPASPLRELANMGTTIDALRAAGIRFVIVHRNDFDDKQFAELTLRRLRALAPEMADLREFGETTAFELNGYGNRPVPIDVAHMKSISLDHLHATTSDGADRIAAAFDRDPDSRWSTDRAQQGDEWIRIDFDQPIRVGGIRLRMAGRSLSDYPRTLVVEGVDDRGSETTLRSGPVLAELAQGLLADADYPSIDIALPAASAPLKAIVLRQTGTTRDSYWSVHEIQVLAK